MRLCVLTTHPIQYMVPWFRSLADDEGFNLHVVFLRELDAQKQGDAFDQPFVWDVPLRAGFSSSVLDAGIEISELPKVANRLIQQVRALLPDAVLITGWNEPALITAYPIVRAFGIPVLVRGDSNDLKPRGVKQRVFHRVLLRVVSAVIVVGEANRRFYLGSGVSADRVFPGCHFVNTEHMLDMADCYAHERERLRVAAGFGPEDFVFAFAGKHVPFKRPQMLIEAAALLRAQGLPVKLLYSGSGVLTESLRTQAKLLDVPAIFNGFLNQSQIWRAYIPADALVLPSDHGETWGLVTNEAMLFGLPVVVSDQVGCAEDLVIEGSTGYVFKDGVDGLAGSMRKLWERRTDAPAMGLEGRKRVVDRFSMDTATAGLREALAYVNRNG